MQRIMDPLAGAHKDANGSLIHTISQADMEKFSPELLDEAAMREAYEKAKTKNDTWDVDEEDEEAYRQAIMEES